MHLQNRWIKIIWRTNQSKKNRPHPSWLLDQNWLRMMSRSLGRPCPSQITVVLLWNRASKSSQRVNNQQKSRKSNYNQKSLVRKSMCATFRAKTSAWRKSTKMSTNANSRQSSFSKVRLRVREARCSKKTANLIDRKVRLPDSRLMTRYAHRLRVTILAFQIPAIHPQLRTRNRHLDPRSCSCSRAGFWGRSRSHWAISSHPKEAHRPLRLSTQTFILCQNLQGLWDSILSLSRKTSTR